MVETEGIVSEFSARVRRLTIVSEEQFQEILSEGDTVQKIKDAADYTVLRVSHPSLGQLIAVAPALGPRIIASDASIEE